jgi:hypothetical protein
MESDRDMSSDAVLSDPAKVAVVGRLHLILPTKKANLSRLTTSGPDLSRMTTL